MNEQTKERPAGEHRYRVRIGGKVSSISEAEKEVMMDAVMGNTCAKCGAAFPAHYQQTCLQPAKASMDKQDPCADLKWHPGFPRSKWGVSPGTSVHISHDHNAAVDEAFKRGLSAADELLGQAAMFTPPKP